MLKSSERIAMEKLADKMDYNRLEQNYCIFKQMEENKPKKDRVGQCFYHNICNGWNEKGCVKRISLSLTESFLGSLYC